MLLHNAFGNNVSDLNLFKIKNDQYSKTSNMYSRVVKKNFFFQI